MEQHPELSELALGGFPGRALGLQFLLQRVCLLRRTPCLHGVSLHLPPTMSTLST